MSIHREGSTCSYEISKLKVGHVITRVPYLFSLVVYHIPWRMQVPCHDYQVGNIVRLPDIVEPLLCKEMATWTRTYSIGHIPLLVWFTCSCYVPADLSRAYCLVSWPCSQCRCNQQTHHYFLLNSKLCPCCYSQVVTAS